MYFILLVQKNKNKYSFQKEFHEVLMEEHVFYLTMSNVKRYKEW